MLVKCVLSQCENFKTIAQKGRVTQQADPENRACMESMFVKMYSISQIPHFQQFQSSVIAKQFQSATPLRECWESSGSCELLC